MLIFAVHYSVVLFLIYSTLIFKHQIDPILSTQTLKTYRPKTGDIILNQFVVRNGIRIPYVTHFPMHASMVWIREGEPFVIDMCVFKVAKIRNYLESTRNRLSGIRVVKLVDFLDTCGSTTYLRRLRGPDLDAEKLEALSKTWGTVEFDSIIAKSYNFGVELAVGWTTMIPCVAEFFRDWCGLSNIEKRRRDNSYYCSEFISFLLQQLQAVKSTKTDHFRVGPTSYLSSGNFLETEGVRIWEKEEIILRSR